jgi:amino acid adenylation domain-containing protein
MSNKFNPFEGPELESIIYTTKAQSEIWTACYFGGKDAARAYNESISIEFDGLLNYSQLERAIQTVVERHEALRATFSTDGVYMSIAKKITVELTHLDLSNLEENAKKSALNKYINDEGYFLFDLVYGPLIKISLLHFSENKHRLIITFHHIICDGWSIGIMLQDLGTIYSAYVENKIADLPESIPFSHYANEEQSFSKSDENKKTEKFWYEIYKNSVPVVNLPTDYPRPSLRTYKCQRLDFVLESNLLSSLKQTGLNNGVSLVTTLLTCFEIFLYQVTGQNDLVVGLPSAGQATTGMNHLIGHCVNLLPLRSRILPDISFNKYLKKRKSELFDAYDHSQLSFGHLLQNLNVARDPSRIPLVPIIFNFDVGMADGVHFSNLSYKLISNPRAYDAFEIVLNASGNEKNLVFEWTYNESLFKPETIKKMMISFEDLIQNVIENPSRILDQITIQNFAKKHSIIKGTKTIYPNSTLHELFAEKVKTFPNSIALEFYDEKITYCQLDKKINQIANYLWSQGLRPGQIVAISLNRSPDLIASIFAILQCGATYLPIDISYPDKRTSLLIEDSGASFFIGIDSKRNFSSTSIFLSIKEILNLIVDFPANPINLSVAGESTAYIIYTSGSTGKPKGVRVSHFNVINLIYSMAKEPGINEKDKMFALTTISFDPMVLEIYLPLLFGACVVFVDDETRGDGQLLLKKAVENKITIMLGTPSIWQMLIDSGWETILNIKAITGGEPLPLSLAHELLSRCNELWNQYGPTETTVCSALTKISVNDNPITIGKPIANTQIYILNEKGIPLNQGEIGEIAIAGDGVSLGYLNRPDLTNGRFIHNTFEETINNKIYLSGDLGKILPNGNIQCLERIDQQIKIRGYRIEIGEIEHILMSIDGIKSAVILAENDILIAFVVVNCKVDSELHQVQLWRNELASQLPAYMIPNIFHILEKLPNTSNNKIDRKTLLEYNLNAESKKVYSIPRTNEEKLVSDIWKKVLNIENIDIFSNFFEIGGHSIKAVKVMTEIEKYTGKRIPLSTLFEHSTIEKFAKVLNSSTEYSDCLVPLKPNGNKTPLFIVHGAGLHVLNFVNLIKYFDENQPVYGIEGTTKEYNEWYESIESMAAHYVAAIIKINPKGPYALAGFSFGGVVAFEMARQLKEQGKTVSLIGLLDTYVDSSYYYASYSRKRLVRYYDQTYRRLVFFKEMLTSLRGLKLRFNSKKEYILKKYFGLKDILTPEETLALEQFTKANSMVEKIVDRYHLKPQNFEVDLFRAKDDETYKLDATHLGWKKIALNGVNIHNISGNHLNIIAPPNDKVLAKMIQDILDKRHENI